jgi:hypothetical protein
MPRVTEGDAVFVVHHGSLFILTFLNNSVTIRRLSTSVYYVHQDKLSGNWIWNYATNCGLNVT